MRNTFLRLSRCLEYREMMEYNMVAILESKMAAILGLFLHIFASGVYYIGT